MVLQLLWTIDSCSSVCLVLADTCSCSVDRATPFGLQGEVTLMGVIERREYTIKKLEQQLYKMRMEKLALMEELREIPRQVHINSLYA